MAMAIALKLKILLSFTLTVLIADILVTCFLLTVSDNGWPIFTGVAAIPLVIFCVILYDIIHLNPAASHTRKTLLSQYRYSIICRVLGPLGMKKFSRQSFNCEKLQENLLHHILKKNKDTEYALKAGLSKTPTVNMKDYSKYHPLAKYETFRPFIDRMIEGKVNVLTPEKPEFFATTSGTTGTAKRYPIVKEHQRRIIAGALAALYTHRKIYKSLKRMWQFRLMSKPTVTADGLHITGLSNKMAQHYPHNIIPSAITQIYTEYPAFYVQAIFALSEPELFFIDGFSSNLMYSFFKFLDANYIKICNDIAAGTINQSVGLSPEIREELNKQLVPNQSRAAFIKQQIELGSAGLAQRIWPELEYVHLGMSAGMKMCADILKNSYLQSIKIFQMAHGASEAFIGYQIEEDVESEVLTMLPDGTTVMEFIPIENCQEEHPVTYPMHKLKIGEEYEVVATTVNGLYRIRFGDIIKVVGYFNNVPKYILRGRMGQQLNVAFERTPENLFYDALCAAEKKCNIPSIEDYTTTESMALETISDRKSAENYYVAFVEFAAKNQTDESSLNDLAAQMDKCLSECHSSYKFTREKGHLSPIVIKEVRPGTFDKIRYTIWGNSQNMQFKMPRVIRRKELLQLLWDSQCKPSEHLPVEEITRL